MAARRASIEHGAEETTPLLNPSNEAPIVQAISRESAGEDAIEEDEDKPLPMGQIFWICFARVVDPICFFCIFPFVNEMIYETGQIPESDVGFYSGLIESLFSVTQMLTMIIWGRLSDRYGRKPVLVGSLIGAACTTSLFGFSKTIWQMIVFRCMAGLFSGTIVTMRTMIGELSTPKTAATAFSYFSFTGNIGIFLGPIIGGSLSNLAKHYPDTFGNFQFLRNHPYATPTLVTGVVAAIAAVTVILFVEETLKTDDSDNKTQKGPTTIGGLIKSEGVPFILYLFAIVAMQGFAYTALVPVYWFTSIRLGGFGLDEREIALFLSITGLSQAAWLLVVFPPLQRRVGTGNVLRICSSAYPFFYAVGPVFNLMLRHGLTTLFWAVGPPMLVIGSGVAMNFTAAQLALNDVSPSPQTLGTLNALAMTLLSAVRAVMPAATTSLFAIGVRKRILGGQLAWLVLVVTTLIMLASLHWLPEKAEGRPIKKPTDTADEENGQSRTYGTAGNGSRNESD